MALYLLQYKRNNGCNFTRDLSAVLCIDRCSSHSLDTSGIFLGNLISLGALYHMPQQEEHMNYGVTPCAHTHTFQSNIFICLVMSVRVQI